MNSIQLIRELTDAFGVSGFEEDVLTVAERYVPEGYNRCKDSLLNFYMYKGEGLRADDCKKKDAPVVLIDAHTDEIGLMVQAVKPNGTLTFTTLGGWIPATLQAQKMQIRNTKGQMVTGVVAAKMHHFGASESEAPSLSQMTIDVGACSREEVINNFHIAPGCPVVPKSEFEQHGDIMIAKAFDDRLGCAAVLETLDKLKDEKLNVNVVGALSSQEEVGIRGAKVVSNRVKPDIAICFEGTPADDTLVESYLMQTALGSGPMLRHIDKGMISNPRCVRLALDTAASKGIDVQEAVRTGGSTNGAGYHIAGLGVPTIVIGCPVRYAHSHHSIAHIGDYKKAVALAVEVIKALTPEVIANM